MNWQPLVPFVPVGAPLNAATLNAPTAALQQRIDILQQQLGSVTSNQYLRLDSVPCAPDVRPGHVVFFNADTYLYEKAVSGWDGVRGESGEMLPRSEMVFAGIAISKAAGNRADLCQQGNVQLSSAELKNLFGTATPAVGKLFFLSQLTPGQVVAARPPAAAAVLRHNGLGIIQVLPFNYEPLTHSHETYTLYPADWRLSSFYPVGVIPAGFAFGYNLNSTTSKDQNLARVTVANTFTNSFYRKDTGIRLNPADFIVNANGVWFKGPAVPTYQVEMITSSADTKGLALVHSIASTDGAFEAENVGGHVDLTLKAFTPEAATGTPYHVITELAPGKSKIIPVPTRVRAGPGIVISSSDGDGHGDCVVSSGLFNGLRLESLILNLNNSVTTVEGLVVANLLPLGRTSSLSGRVNLPDLGDSADRFQARFFVQVLSDGAAVASPVVEVSPTAGSFGVGYPVAAATPLAMASIPAVTAGYVVAVVSTAVIDLTGLSGGQIFFRVSSAGGVAYKVVASGILVELKT